MLGSPEYLARLKYEQSILKAELSLYEFVKQAWHVIEGNKPFTDGWVVQVICEHIEALAKGQIKKLLINIPPRCSKSTIISVAFPAWWWIQKPSEQFLCASYALSLSNRDSVACRRLINSQWYQERWGHLYKLEKDQNTKGRFDNTARGYRIATSAGSSITGEGADILIMDDPNNALDAHSLVKREGKQTWYSHVFSTRLNNKETGRELLVMQRLHQGDLTGYIIDNDDLKIWTALILAMEFEASRRSTTIVLPSTNGKRWTDPRTKEGELLWEERFNRKQVDIIKQGLGSAYAISGQLQQRPTPEGGHIIKKDWFQWWKEPRPPEMEFIIQSWDTALTKSDINAYSACTTWGVFRDHNDIANIILLSVWRDRIEYPELRERMKRLFFDYRDTKKDRDPSFNGRPLDMCVVENLSTGGPLIQDMARAGVKLTAFIPSRKLHGDKIGRVRHVSHYIENGLVWVPAKAPNYDRLLPFADMFLENAAAFPNADTRDLIDTMTQALIKLKDSNFLHPRGDEKILEPSYKEVRLY